MTKVQGETETKGGRGEMPTVLKNGWIPLEWWLKLNPGYTREDAMEFCNPNSRRTSRMFNQGQVRKTARGRYDVWYQPLNFVTKTYSPEFVDRPNRGSRTRTQVSRTRFQEPSNRAPTLPNGESQRSSEHPSLASQGVGGAG